MSLAAGAAIPRILKLGQFRNFRNSNSSPPRPTSRTILLHNSSVNIQVLFSFVDLLVLCSPVDLQVPSALVDLQVLSAPPQVLPAVVWRRMDGGEQGTINGCLAQNACGGLFGRDGAVQQAGASPKRPLINISNGVGTCWFGSSLRDPCDG